VDRGAIVANSTKLLLLPGLGADARQFEPQRVAFPNLIAPSWIRPHSNETLPDYAGRMAETAPRGERLVLGGSSFGGMVAWEMARHVRPKAVVLIGSCTGPEGIAPLLGGLRPLSAALSPAFVGMAKKAAPLAIRLFGPRERAHREICLRMFRDADANWIRWGVRAILAWQPSKPCPDVPVRHIHGARDRVLPVGRSAADRIISGGGHLINMTHADEVNGLLRDVLAEFA